jgi:hypothetical protein
MAEDCPKLVRDDCETWTRHLDEKQPGVVLAARDPEGKELLDVRVVDGRLELAALDGKPLLVDPGPHTFRFERPPYAAVSEEVLVREGEKSRLVTVGFAALPRNALDQPARAPAAEPSAARTPAPWIVAGTGLALTIIGVASSASKPRAGDTIVLATGLPTLMAGGAWLLLEPSAPAFGPRGAPWLLAGVGGSAARGLARLVPRGRRELSGAVRPVDGRVRPRNQPRRSARRAGRAQLAARGTRRRVRRRDARAHGDRVGHRSPDLEMSPRRQAG